MSNFVGLEILFTNKEKVGKYFFCRKSDFYYFYNVIIKVNPKRINICALFVKLVFSN